MSEGFFFHVTALLFLVMSNLVKEQTYLCIIVIMARAFYVFPDKVFFLNPKSIDIFLISALKRML